jgi:hypothetical protein
MGVVICLPLFGPPGRELEEGAPLVGKPLRDLAAELTERLHKAADTLDKLSAAGWHTQLAMYDVLLSRPGIETQDEAVRRLSALGVNTEELMIIEEVAEDED